MSTRTATPLPRRSEAQNHRAADTRDRGTSGPTGLWILPVMWKTPAMRSAQLSGRRRRVSHNTLDAADGAHRLHRHLRPCSRTPRHE